MRNMEQSASKRIEILKRNTEHSLKEIDTIEKLNELYPDLTWSNEYSIWSSRVVNETADEFELSWNSGTKLICISLYVIIEGIKIYTFPIFSIPIGDNDTGLINWNKVDYYSGWKNKFRKCGIGEKVIEMVDKKIMKGRL